jgi:hypothetical protein
VSACETFDALGNRSVCEYTADDPALYSENGLLEIFE